MKEYIRVMRRFTRKGGGREERERKARAAAIRAAEHASSTNISEKIDLSKNEEDTRQDLIRLFVSDFIQDFRDVALPNTKQFEQAAQRIDERLVIDDMKEVFGDTQQYDQDVADENYTFKQSFKLVLMTMFRVCIEESEKVLKNNSEKRQLDALKMKYKSIIDTLSNSTVVPKGFDLKRFIGTMDMKNTQMDGGGGASSKLGLGLAAAALTNSGLAQPVSGPSQSVINLTPMHTALSRGTITPTQPYVSQSANSSQNHTNSNNLDNSTTLTFNTSQYVPPRQSNIALQQSNPINAAQQLIINQEQHPIILNNVQQQGLALVSFLYNNLGVQLPYNPLDADHDPVITEQMKQKFGFIRDALRKLKETLSIHSPERFQVLQYYSFLNILERISIGKLNLVEESPTHRINTYIKTPVNEVNEAMIQLANYNNQYTNITIYLIRKKPTIGQKMKSLFTFENAVNYIVEEIDIFYTFKGNQYVIQLTPNQLEEAFIPFAFRFLFSSDKVLNIHNMIKSVKSYFTIEPTFAGFWSTDLATHTILARLKGANTITKQIISVVGQYTKLASEMASYKHFDYLVSHLGKIVKDPGQSVALRIKAAEIRDATYDLVEQQNVWTPAMTSQLADMATQMAIVSGRLDETIREDQVTMEFIQNITSKVGNALKDTISGVVEAGELVGAAARNTVGVANDLRLLFLNKETAIILIVFLTKYISYATGSLRNACATFFSAGLLPVTKTVGSTVFAQLGNVMLQDATGGYLNTWLTTCTMICTIAVLADKVEQMGPAAALSSITYSISSFLYQSTIGRFSQATRANPVAANVRPSDGAPSSARRKRAFGPAMTPRATLSSSNLSAAAALSALPNSGAAPSSSLETPRLRPIGEKGAIVPARVPYSSAISKKELNARNAKITAEMARLGLRGGYTRKRKHNTKRTRRHRR